MEFEDALEELFPSTVIEAYKKALYTSPEALKETTITCSIDDLITIWNRGVENGVEGCKKYGF